MSPPRNGRRLGVGDHDCFSPLLLRQVPLPPEGILAVAVGVEHRMKDAMAAMTSSRTSGVLLCGALGGSAVDHDDGGREVSSVAGTRDAFYTREQRLNTVGHELLSAPSSVVST